MGKRYSILDNSKIGKIFRDDAVDSINFSFHAGVFVHLKWSWTHDYISLTIIALVTSTKKHSELTKHVHICRLRNRTSHSIITDASVFTAMRPTSS